MIGQHEDKSFGSTEQEAQAFNQNKIQYSPKNDDQQPENGAIAAQQNEVNVDPNREAPTGQDSK